MIEGPDLETVRAARLEKKAKNGEALPFLIVHLLGPSFPSLSRKLVVNRNKQIKSQYDDGIERLAAYFVVCVGIFKPR